MPTADFFNRYLDALADIHASFSLETTEAAVVRNAALLFGARGASIMLFNPGEENLVISATFGLSEAYRGKGAVSPSRSLGETIQRAPVVVRDVATDPKIQYREATLQEGIASVVGLPLTAGSALVGSLRLYFAQPRDFSLEEMEQLQALALQAGLALKKAFYFASMKAAVSEIQGMPAANCLSLKASSRARMMVFRYRMTSAEMWARSVAPSVYSVYIIRRSWSTLLKACPRLQILATSREPLGIRFTNAGIRDVLNFIGNSTGINVTYDRDFQDRSITIQLEGVTLEQALQLTLNELEKRVIPFLKLAGAA